MAVTNNCTDDRGEDILVSLRGSKRSSSTARIPPKCQTPKVPIQITKPQRRVRFTIATENGPTDTLGNLVLDTTNDLSPSVKPSSPSGSKERDASLPRGRRGYSTFRQTELNETHIQGAETHRRQITIPKVYLSPEPKIRIPAKPKPAKVICTYREGGKSQYMQSTEESRAKLRDFVSSAIRNTVRSETQNVIKEELKVVHESVSKLSEQQQKLQSKIDVSSTEALKVLAHNKKCHKNEARQASSLNKSFDNKPQIPGSTSPEPSIRTIVTPVEKNKGRKPGKISMWDAVAIALLGDSAIPKHSMSKKQNCMDDVSEKPRPLSVCPKPKQTISTVRASTTQAMSSPQPQTAQSSPIPDTIFPPAPPPAPCPPSPYHYYGSYPPPPPGYPYPYSYPYYCAPVPAHFYAPTPTTQGDSAQSQGHGSYAYVPRNPPSSGENGAHVENWGGVDVSVSNWKRP